MSGVGAAGRRLVVLLAPVRARVRGIAEVAIPVVAALFLASLVLDSREPIPGPVRALGILVGAGQGLALFWRRTCPRTVMAITTAGGLVVQLIAPETLFPYAGMAALWTLAAAQPPRISLVALTGLLGVSAVSWPTAKPGETPFVLVVVVVVWALGEATRSRSVAIEQASRRASAQGQSRLALDVHDVIAHSVSVIVVQAAAADDVFEDRPDQARAALRSIEATGREAMGELRRLLAALGPAQGAEGLRPAPDLDRLTDLIGPVRAVGLSVQVRREDDPGVVVPAGVGLSAYRIVQEALTNTVRHAQATQVEVLVRATRTAVEVTVLDDGRGNGHRASQVAGRGIAGMRERAALLGGTLDAGPRPAGGFGVRARLPLRVPS